jgi:hypothetical protein
MLVITIQCSRSRIPFGTLQQVLQLQAILCIKTTWVMFHMCMYAHLYIHVSMYVCMYVCMYVHIYVYICMYMCTYVYIYIYIYICISMDSLCKVYYSHTWMYAESVYMYIHAHVYMYIYIYRPLELTIQMCTNTYENTHVVHIGP